MDSTEKIPEQGGELFREQYGFGLEPLSVQIAFFHEMAVEETYGGICEFIMKDNHTIGNNPDNLIRWTQIMREKIARKY